MLRLLGLAVLLAALVMVPVTLGATGERVVDLADLFEPAQEEELAGLAASIGSQYGMDIVLVTTRDAGGKSAMAFADDFFDENGYGVGPDRDGILFLVDLDNREAWISTSGNGIRYLTDQRIESILDAVYAGGLEREDFNGAARAFLASTAGFLAQGIPEDQVNRLTGGEGIFGILLSGIAGLFMNVGTRRRYKARRQAIAFDFRSNSALNLGIVQDQLVNTFVTTRIRPQPTATSGSRSFGGRSTTHRSGSGRIHGGGGRKF